MAINNQLAEYAERSSSLIEESPQMDEQNTRRKIIEPLIELLGWDILSSSVELEYSVQMGSGAKKVDYALKLEETPVVFIEAKGCDTSIVDSHRDQLRSYMRQLGVDWGMISNGQEFEIFRRDKDSPRPNEISLGRFPLNEIESKSNLLKALSQESIASGESESIANRVEARRASAKTLRTKKDDFAQQITQLLTDEVGEAVSQKIEDEAKTFIDQLTEALETESAQPIPDYEPRKRDSAEGRYGIELIRNGSVIADFHDDLQKSAMAAMVDYLILEEGLIDEIEIPYVPGTGRGARALLNDKPVHTNGQEMRAYEELSSGYYLYTSLSANDKIRYVSELPNIVNLDSEFVGDW